jgi:hypothetical protein
MPLAPAGFLKVQAAARGVDILAAHVVRVTGPLGVADFRLAQGNSRRQSEASEDQALRLSKGDRVQLSELGCSRHPRNTKKIGTIVGNSQDPNSLRIVWDGSRWPVAVHREYLELLKDEISNADGRPRLLPRKGKRAYGIRQPRCGRLSRVSLMAAIGTSKQDQ